MLNTLNSTGKQQNKLNNFPIHAFFYKKWLIKFVQFEKKFVQFETKFVQFEIRFVWHMHGIPCGGDLQPAIFSALRVQKSRSNHNMVPLKIIEVLQHGDLGAYYSAKSQ